LLRRTWIDPRRNGTAPLERTHGYWGWYRDVLVEAALHGATDYFVTLGTPFHANVTGDSAYVVILASMTFTVNGRRVTQSGAVFTVALRKSADRWRIAAWAWAKGKQSI
jgi:ketosteroid isomerase-like protein